MSRTGYKVANDRNRYEVLALETERLRLSVLRKSEASRVNAYFVKNRDFHKKYSQTHTEDYFTVSMQRKYLAYDYNSFLDGTLVPLWITLKETGEIIGRVSFFNFAFGGMMSCACGYHLDKDHTGKGYMTEALKGAMAFVFDEYKLHRILHTNYKKSYMKAGQDWYIGNGQFLTLGATKKHLLKKMAYIKKALEKAAL